MESDPGRISTPQEVPVSVEGSLSTSELVDAALAMQKERSEITSRLFTFLAELDDDTLMDFMGELGSRFSTDLHGIQQVLKLALNLRGGYTRDKRDLFSPYADSYHKAARAVHYSSVKSGSNDLTPS